MAEEAEEEDQVSLEEEELQVEDSNHVVVALGVLQEEDSAVEEVEEEDSVVDVVDVEEEQAEGE